MGLEIAALAALAGPYIANAAAGLALSVAASRLFGPKGPSKQDLQNEIQQSDAPRTHHQGRVRVSGPKMFYDWTTEVADGKRYLHKLLAIDTGGVDSFLAFWLNDTKVDLAGTEVSTAPWDGGTVNLYTRDGRQGSEYEGGYYPVLAGAFPDNWTLGTGTDVAHRLSGVATVLARMRSVKAAKLAETYPGGDPKVSVLLRGAPVYDPRLGARSPSTMVYSENIALQILDDLVNEDHGRLSLDGVILPSFIAAANDCDDAMALKAGGTNPRYFGGGSFGLNQALKDRIRPKLLACAGSLYTNTSGQIGLRVGKLRAPSFTITEEHIVGIEGRSGSGEFRRVTTFIPKYTEPNFDYQLTTAAPWVDEAELALIGETEPEELPLEWCQHHAQCDRIAKILAAKRNPKWRFDLRLRFWGLKLISEESVYLHLPVLGIHNEPFEIRDFRFNPGVKQAPTFIALAHMDESSFAFDPASEESDPPVRPDPVQRNDPPIPAPVIVSTEVRQRNGLPWIRAAAAVSSEFRLVGGYKKDTDAEWTPVEVDQDSGVLKTPLIDNAADHSIRFGYQRSTLVGSDVAYAEVTGLEVNVSPDPPDPPTLVSASEDGTDVTIVFRPDLGANYWRTLVMRGADEASALAVATTYATAEETTITVPVVEGVSYWVLSQNHDVKSSGFTFAIAIATGGGP